MRSFLSANEISPFFSCNFRKIFIELALSKREVNDRVDGFGTLDPPCIHGSDVRHNVYSGRHSIYFVPRVSPYVRPPFIPRRLSLSFSLCSRYMRVYTFAKKTIILRAGLACGGALCVVAVVSLSPRSSNLRNHFVGTGCTIIGLWHLHGPRVR